SFFFFQAEDGIRDDLVTGVQTCALPISLGPHGFLVLTWDEGVTDAGCCGRAHGGRIATVVAGPDVRHGARMRAPVDHYGVLRTEIGRAACREREEGAVRSERRRTKSKDE